jgi:Asp/Glu/hydantoin racemase
MRILLVNANTTAAITDRLVAAATAMAPTGTVFVGATGRFGARYIASRAACAIAAHAALDCYAAQGEGADAVLLACFGEPGIEAVREVAPVPVVGLAEASAAAALRVASRFAVVTGGAAWGPMLAEFYAARGLSDRVAAIRTVAPSGGELARDPEGAVALLAAACARCAAEDGAEAIVLGGAGLLGFAAPVAERAKVPVICSVEAGIRAVIEAAAAGRREPKHLAPVETVALSPELARLLG